MGNTASKAKSIKAPLPRLTPADRIAEVTEALSGFISKSGLEPGDRLPTERELMEALGVGRSTVREVIRQFQARGLVESKQGSGTYLVRVASREAIHVPLIIDLGTGVLRDQLLRALEVRRGLEVEASAVAAKNATPEDIEIMEEALEIMERSHLAHGTAGEEDRGFHLAIYDATHNPLFRQLLEQIQDAFDRFFAKPFDRSDFASRSFPYHRALFNAIRDKDIDLARSHTMQILDVVEEDIKEMSK
jgi:GntR family transcriptional regulator, transcriptional repressor for pyruvate dehydrogenase complex